MTLLQENKISETKRCTVCEEIKELNQFSERKQPKVKNPCKKYYRPSCKKCNAELAQKFRDNNREKYLRQFKKRYNQNKEKYQEKTRKWYSEHKEQILSNEKNKKRKSNWSKNNRDKVAISNNNWKKNNWDRVLKSAYKLKAKHRNELKDDYVIRVIHQQFGISTLELHKYPELIENWRQQIKVKRLLKQKKHENITTS